MYILMLSGTPFVLLLLSSLLCARGMDQDRTVVLQRHPVHSDGSEKVAFLFVMNNTFPHLKTWQAFFAGAPANLYSLHVLLVPLSLHGREDASHASDLRTLDQMGATILTTPKASGANDVSQHLNSPLSPGAIRALLRVAMEEQPRATRFCLLPGESTPLYPFYTVHGKLLADIRSSVDACHRPRIHPGVRWGGLWERFRGGPGAKPWAVLTRRHALEVIETEPFSPKLLKRFCDLRGYAVAAHIIPMVLRDRANETDCMGGMIRPAGDMDSAGLVQVRRMCQPSKWISTSINTSNASSSPHCPLFVVYEPSIASSLHAFCLTLLDDLQRHAKTPAARGHVIATLSSAPCQSVLDQGVHQLSPIYLQALDQIRVQAAREIDRPTLLNSTSITNHDEILAPFTVQHQKQLLVAFSFWLPKWRKVATSFELLHTHGDPCSGKAAPFMSLMMAPAFDPNASLSDFTSVQQSLSSVIDRLAARCFSSVGWHKTNLTWAQSGYPLAPTVQFFKLIFEPSFRARFDVMFLMEQDIFPIQPLSLDALYREALSPKFFWLKGTMVRGSAYEKPNSVASWMSDIPWLQRNKDWLCHMNGAALYGLNYPLFDAILRATELLSASNPEYAWDILLELVLKDVRDECVTHDQTHIRMVCDRRENGKPTTATFPITQHISTRIHYTDLVWNVGSQAARPTVLDAAHAAGVFLLHGTAKLPMREEAHLIRLQQQKKTRAVG